MDRIPLKPDVAPSVQLKEANAVRRAASMTRYSYLPHVGAKQRAKALRAAAKAEAKAAASGGG